MSKKTFLQKAIDFSISELNKVDNEINKLSIQVKTVIIVHTAQGLIDNGGLEYFFGLDFPNNPPYYIFVDAYKRIGAIETAQILQQAISMFPFNNPHLYEDKRNNFIDLNTGDDKEFTQLGNKVCGDTSVWDKLEKYIKENKIYFNFK